MSDKHLEAAIEASAREWARMCNSSGPSLVYGVVGTDQGWEDYVTDEHEAATIAAVEAWVGDREPLYTFDFDALAKWIQRPRPIRPADVEILAAWEKQGVLVRVSVTGREPT